MIAISTLTPSTYSSVAIDTLVDYRDATARVSRTQLLDGTVYINNSGYTDGDRTVRVSEKVTVDQETALWYIFRNSTSVNISLPDGFFKGTITGMAIDNGLLQMTIFLELRRSE